MVVGCQPYAPTAFTPRKYSWYSFMLEAESTPGPQCYRKDFMSMKNPPTPAGIEPASFRCVAQHLNHCATAVPASLLVKDENHQATNSRDLITTSPGCLFTRVYSIWTFLKDCRTVALHSPAYNRLNILDIIHITKE